MYTVLTILISISALFGYVNNRFLKMPFVIGLFFLATSTAILVLCIKYWYPQPYIDLKEIVVQSNISKFILNIMLGFLLFAGALQTNWLNFKQYLKQITIFALIGVLISTVIIAVLFFGFCNIFNLNVEFIYCLLFGALISPTDPIAVLGILTKAKVSKRVETIIIGESLFNDGVGVVVFVVLLEVLLTGNTNVNFGTVSLLFLKEAVGGIVFGLVAGLLLHHIVKTIDDYETEVLLTIAFVMAGYSICQYLHLSGALAMVVMGLLFGNYKKESTMSIKSKEYVTKFWQMVDIILYAILFILIALVLLVMDLQVSYIFLGLCSIVIVLFSRVVVVYLPMLVINKIIKINNKEAKIIVWGGLRGGLSLALVLSLPPSYAQNILLIATYICVLFSIIVQGLTIEGLAKKMR